MIGTIVDERYRIEAELGVGGVGNVYVATHLKLGRSVALKVLQKKFVANRELTRRFKREARALAALSHPNVVTVTDYGTVEGSPYLVMELLRGRTLAERLELGSLEPDEIFDIARQMLRGLSYVHQSGLVHRDLKPGNIFLQELAGSSSHVKLLDFGFAKFVDPAENASQLTQAGQVFGTPTYMAPEQATARQTDSRSDVYSVGIILFDMLAGRPPFVGDPLEIIRQHLNEPLPAFEDVSLDCRPTPELRRLIQRATEKQPEKRFGDGSEMARALDALPQPAFSRQHHADGSIVALSSRELVTAPPSGSDLALPLKVPRGKTKSPSAKTATKVRKGEPRSAKRGLVATLISPIRWLVRGAAWCLLVAAVLAVAEAALWVLVLDGPQRAEHRRVIHQVLVMLTGDETKPAPSPSSSGRALSAAGSSGFSTPDPWREPPKELEGIHRRITAGALIDRKALASLHAYNAAHPTKPHGHLLLAHTYASRGWMRDALSEYDAAYQADAQARGDPTMLGNLIAFAMRGSDGASQLMEKAYGPEAVPAIDQKLASRDLQAIEAERLQRIRSRLVEASHPPGRGRGE